MRRNRLVTYASALWLMFAACSSPQGPATRPSTSSPSGLVPALGLAAQDLRCPKGGLAFSLQLPDAGQILGVAGAEGSGVGSAAAATPLPDWSAKLVQTDSGPNLTMLIRDDVSGFSMIEIAHLQLAIKDPRSTPEAPSIAALEGSWLGDASAAPQAEITDTAEQGASASVTVRFHQPLLFRDAVVVGSYAATLTDPSTGSTLSQGSTTSAQMAETISFPNASGLSGSVRMSVQGWWLVLNRPFRISIEC